MGSLLLAGMLVMPGLAAAGRDLRAGMPAPAFEAEDQHGHRVRLADFLGKANVVLYFYPKDDTRHCTAEACALRDHYAAIRAAGAVVLGVSADRVDRHAAFAAKYQLPFPILADPRGDRIIRPYGVRVPVLGIAWRVTFVIDRAGIIRDIIRKVDPGRHDQQVLQALGRL
jgi:peroxiredoxin Q/BCP